MKTNQQVYDLTQGHEVAVWNAIQTKGEGNPPSSAAGQAARAAMIAERGAASVFYGSNTPAAEAAFDSAYNLTSQRLAAWTSAPAAAALTSSSAASSTTAAAGKGLGAGALLAIGAAAYYFWQKKKGVRKPFKFF